LSNFAKNKVNIKFVLSFPKGTFLRETASCEPSCVKIRLVAFAAGDDKKKGCDGLGWEGIKSQKAIYFTYSWEAPCEQISTKFCTPGDMPDLIICANFGEDWDTRGQSLGSPIETAGQPCNSAALPHSL